MKAACKYMIDGLMMTGLTPKGTTSLQYGDDTIMFLFQYLDKAITFKIARLVLSIYLAV